MKRFIITIALLAFVAPTAEAGHIGFGGVGGFSFGGFGGGRHGGFHGFFHGGFGGLNTERLQTRFETKFEDLMTDYDTGLAEIDDFVNSDEYADVVDGVERLVDHYDLFLSGVERTVQRLDDIIAIANDDLSFYADLLAEYEARDDLSEERLDRIVARLTSVQDHLTMKIDLLAEKQTTLSENLDSYQMFSDDLTAYLSEILDMGGGTTEPDATTTTGILATSAPVAALAATADPAAFVQEASFYEPPPSALAATAVAEPGSSLLVALAAAVLAFRRPPYGRMVI